MVSDSVELRGGGEERGGGIARSARLRMGSLAARNYFIWSVRERWRGASLSKLEVNLDTELTQK
jgi:hypothetical protein